MRAGQLRHRVTINAPVRSTSATSGAVSISYVPVSTIWASVKPLTARESANYASNQLYGTHEVRCRYTADITGDTTLTFEGREFHVIGPPINVDERNIELKMLVAEKKVVA